MKIAVAMRRASFEGINIPPKLNIVHTRGLRGSLKVYGVDKDVVV